MAFTFPSSPATNDTYSVGSRTYTWTGTKWVLSGGIITSTQLEANSVTTAKIAANAVTEAKIGAGAVTQAKLTSGLSGITVTTTALRDTVIPSPFAGQFAFLTDTNAFIRWNGSAWVTAIVSAPTEAPTSLALDSATTTTATISFAAGADGGSEITNYQYALSTNGGSSYGSYNALNPADASSPITITGLTAGTAYYLKLKAVNAQGASNVESQPLSFSTNVLIEYLVIAGGGSGGTASDAGNSEGGGGGGAGGYRCSVSSETTGGGGSAETPIVIGIGLTYTIAVGGGGAAVSSQITNGNKGSDSYISGTGLTTITAEGGGYGGRGTNGGGGAGGSGGGGGAGSTGGTAGARQSSPVQGFAGTAGQNSARGGGGGGASATGVLSGSSLVGSAGGAGMSSSITGSAVTRGGGGGGGGYSTGGAGGTGGGGNGGGGATGSAGTANRGGGGGGGGRTSASGAGGSGVVILRYPDQYTITIGAGLTGSTSTSGSNKVTTITAGSGNVSWA